MNNELLVMSEQRKSELHVFHAIWEFAQSVDTLLNSRIVRLETKLQIVTRFADVETSPINL